MKVLVSAVLSIAVALVLSSCGDAGDSLSPDRPLPQTTSTTLPDVAPLISLQLESLATGLNHPVAIAPAPGLGETFVVERTGRLSTLSSSATSVVLDITSIVGWDISEQGFLGFAVHPKFPSDARGFAVYTNLDRDVVVASFAWDGERFSAASEGPILLVPQPHQYHQGGGIVFGPRGYLWLTFGDGGGIGDSFENAQNPDSYNGTIVRIDVDHGDPYATPVSNPFVDTANGLPEVWAYGLRNPWRIALDGNQVVISDVGQVIAEEINIVDATEGGYNFGWPVVEGDSCFEADHCDRTGFSEPDIVIGRERACAVIGGPIYRGTSIPELNGHYLFGDHCIGWVRSALLLEDGLGSVVDWEPMLGRVGLLTTFGIDHNGELLVATLGGDVSRIVPVR